MHDRKQSGEAVAAPSPVPPCPVCGGTAFVDHAVLWPELVTAWGLSPAETAYINRQQGTLCTSCGANIRSMALAKALSGYFGYDEPLRATTARLMQHGTGSVLEINEAGTLHSELARLPGYRFVGYPDYDLMDLDLPDASFDVVVHSDTLEHIPDPLAGLRECRRILKTGGALIFTVPIIIGRLTRSRAGLPPSFHGMDATRESDLMVHTEFGADAWATVCEAGFSRCEFVTFDFPAGIALIARK